MPNDNYKKEVAAVAVLYNPDDDVVDNLRECAPQVDRLYVVDNSEKPLPAELEHFLASEPGVEHVRLGENLGIARALNEGADRAREAGYRWLLTMDQDSRATPDMVRRLWLFATSGTVPRVGIVAARPDNPRRQEGPAEEWTIVPSVMASGNLVSLAAWNEVGGMVEELFIDYVDTVFSLAMRHAGWSIVQLNGVVLHHRLGKSEVRRFLGVKMVPTHHNHIRKYYIARNRAWMYSRYRKIFPEYILGDCVNILKEWTKLFLFEDRKWLKIRMSLRGLRDFRHGKLGKCRWS